MSLCRGTWKPLLVLCVLTGFFPLDCRAGVQGEIGRLIAYIENSGCTFVRNGKEHTAGEAADHIRLKRRRAQRWIRTAEDFIEVAATKSSVSGQPYTVRCGSRAMPCAEWLHAELLRLRGAALPPAATKTPQAPTVRSTSRATPR